MFSIIFATLLFIALVWSYVVYSRWAADYYLRKNPSLLSIIAMEMGVIAAYTLAVLIILKHLV